MIDIIEQNYKASQFLMDLIRKESDELQKIRLIQICAKFMSQMHTGQFSSWDLEQELIHIANNHPVKLSESYRKNSMLHVFTTCYGVGGHTRVVDNWIRYSADEYVNSVILLNQKSLILPVPVPQWLSNTILSNNGDLIDLSSEKNPIARALKLRQISSEYEFVVLHVHPNDAVPVLAYGNSSFGRPVIFYNHADHIFWLGSSIADTVADLRSLGQNITKTRRGTDRSGILPIPIEDRNTNAVQKKIAKEKLGFRNKKIILSIGSAYKYSSIPGYDFMSTALDILEKNPESVFFVIGPTLRDAAWKDGFKKSNCKLMALGIKEKEEMEDYISGADLYIESFPIPSFTAALDVASRGVPIIPFNSSPMGHCDVFADPNIGVTLRELPTRVGEALASDKNIDYAHKIKGVHINPFWGNTLKTFLKTVPNLHSIKPCIQKEKTPGEIDNYLATLGKIPSIKSDAVNFESYSQLSLRNFIKVSYFYISEGLLSHYTYQLFARHFYLR